VTEETRPLIAPLSAEETRKQEELARRIQEAELAEGVRILENDPTPSGLADLIKSASEFAEAVTQKFRHPQSPLVACKQGCYWCCYQNVLVSAPEAFRIAHFVMKEMPNDLRPLVVERLRRLDAKARGTSSEQRAKLHEPCAFLRDGACSIYSVRPLSCAEFTSFDVSACKRAQRIGFPHGSVTHEKARLIAFNAVSKGLFGALSKALPTADSSPLELTAAVVIALDTPEAERRWLQGEDLFSGAFLVGGVLP